MRGKGGVVGFTVCAEQVEGLVGSSVGKDMKDDCLVTFGTVVSREDFGDGGGDAMTLHAGRPIQEVWGRASDQEDSGGGVESLVAQDVLGDVGRLG